MTLSVLANVPSAHKPEAPLFVCSGELGDLQCN